MSDTQTRDAGPYTRHTLPASSAPPLSNGGGGGGGKAAGELPSSSRGGGCCGGTDLKRRRMAYVALGSNMGQRVAMIEQACREMDKRGIRVRRTSSLWETEPMYVLDQGMFVNGVCEVETHWKPLALLDQLQEIENSMGRQKVTDKGPRNIDLDLLLFEGERVDHERLKIPHVGIAEREFVLRPLSELIPNQPINPDRPWKLAQDYLNELPPSVPPLTPLTPLSLDHAPLLASNPTRKTHVMAILNLTPDSFSDGGRHSPTDSSALIETIRSYIDAGATIIDVGGQSTAPGAPEVTLEEELGRVMPAVEAIRATPRAPGGQRVLISVDTYRAAVAEAAVAAGADMINDVSAGALDPEMLPTAARLGVTSDSEAMVAGVRRWRIVLDPGLGFAKETAAQNLEVLRGLADLRRWPGLEGLPWLVGPSRKRFVGHVTGVREPAARTWGTAAAVAAAVHGGADIVRVHDVREMAQVVAMSDAIWRH
ncbi:folic acid synthesis protein [Gaeumannomyces tritici R3-111a-1]|uniref:2-amino-4-hydroxy-6-hydroxymethyldihydropteridine diphosphokinase n=1 Tax=Gaeumannomyces tritici (strain R3-111a-1) TaxID=644352 RepID=J3P4R9_GAET3|nr:folic acid synthesis protein [Gaeumannomyces tritici R3-111a-1]EJT74666.1 folic acid synthesis protein [Gaeumannomyces tritici R3-111a-1]